MKFKKGDRVAVYDGKKRIYVGTIMSKICCVRVDRTSSVFVNEKQLRRLVKKKKVIENFKTSKGYVFQKTKSGWIDIATGLEWQNELKTNLNHYDAEKWAQEKNLRLPTIEEYNVAEEHGIRDIPDMRWKGYWFWSSTPHSYYSYNALLFDGLSGYTGDFVNRRISAGAVAARCISEANK